MNIKKLKFKLEKLIDELKKYDDDYDVSLEVDLLHDTPAWIRFDDIEPCPESESITIHFSQLWGDEDERA